MPAGSTRRITIAALSAAVSLLLPALPFAVEPAGAAQADTGDPALPILDDATLRREYEEYRASVAGMRRYRVSYIRVATDVEARELIAKIRSGADFAALARRHSIHQESADKGGDLGTHASCRWAKSTLEMLDSLKRGQTWSKPVKGTHGWGIYRLDSVTDVQPRPFARYKSELLSGKFEPECPWVPPVTIAPAPAGVQPGPGLK